MIKDNKKYKFFNQSKLYIEPQIFKLHHKLTPINIVYMMCFTYSMQVATYIYP